MSVFYVTVESAGHRIFRRCFFGRGDARKHFNGKVKWCKDTAKRGTSARHQRAYTLTVSYTEQDRPGWKGIERCELIDSFSIKVCKSSVI